MLLPGARIKTDRRDATQLVLLYRTDALAAGACAERSGRGRRWTQTKAWSNLYLAWLQMQCWPMPALAHPF